MITNLTKEKFFVDEKEFELRTWDEDGIFHSQAFFPDDLPANPFTYKILVSEDVDFLKQHGIPGKDVLKARTIEDIREGYVYGMKLPEV